MRQFYLTTALVAGVLALSAVAPANAITVTFVQQDLVTVPVTSFGFQAPTTVLSGTTEDRVGSLANEYRSPWQNTDETHIDPQHDSLHYTSVHNGDARYNLSGTALSLFWGSPDDYNSITFFTGLDGGGTSVTYFGSSLGFVPAGKGHDYVTIFLSEQFNSVVLHSDKPAFEFANMETCAGGRECAAPPGATPLPAALPLFASAFGVVGGMLGWRKRRRIKSAAVTVPA